MMPRSNLLRKKTNVVRIGALFNLGALWRSLLRNGSLLLVGLASACVHRATADWSTAIRHEEAYAPCANAREGESCTVNISDPMIYWPGVCAADRAANNRLLCVSTVEQIQEAREAQARRESEEASKQEQEKPQPRTPTWLEQAMQACDLAADKAKGPSGRMGIDVATLPDGHCDARAAFLKGLDSEHVKCLVAAVERDCTRRNVKGLQYGVHHVYQGRQLQSE